ncbi:SLX4 endonuclease, partial [Atractosteus spatula]|nr:SLX4 endonuclease [Atractosteus spatula]
MEDSDEDFTELCTKVLRRVKKAEGENGQQRDIGAPRGRGRLRRGAGGKRGPDPGSKRKGCGSGRASQTAVPLAVCPAPEMLSAHMSRSPGVQGPGRMGVKEKVVRRLQQFKRVSPERLTHTDLGTGRDRDTTASGPVPAVVLDPQGDEALACQLQEALQREALGLEGLEEGGLFFCQICQKDLSAMNSLRRTQHLNRCLDDAEASAPPSSTGVPECPICGKEFRHPKTRAAHLKRCASEMGVPPAQLLEAIKRQAEDQGGNTARPHPPGGRSKRRGAGDPGRPAKRPRKQAEPLDEDTMLALALSRSMAEEEEAELKLKPPGKAPGVQGRPTAGRRRRKAAPGPLPLLLAQDPEAARRRLQERAAALLLREWPRVPPGPGLPTSALRAERGGVGLWERSALRDVDCGPAPAPAFYSRELVPPIEPWAPASIQYFKNVLDRGFPGPEIMLLKVCATSTDELGSPAAELGTQPVTSDPGGAPSPQGSQTLCDLMELAGEGLTLTQWGLRPAGAPGAAQDRGTDATVTDLPLSGFVPAAENIQAAPQGSVAQCQLVSDLAGMVNNPQLSDVQFQTDSGDVLFAHSFMLYARCPLLVQLVHDEGFSVEEEAMPPARRVLLGEVPPEAARLLLQYLYTARCSLSPALAPPLQDLASRFGLKELEELCRDTAASGEAREEVEARLDSEEECSNSDRNFQELLRSMWVEEEEEEEDGQGLGRREEDNERVGEEELEEIYEFAATQGRTVGRSEGESEEEEEDEECLNTGSEDAGKDRKKEEDSVSQTPRREGAGKAALDTSGASVPGRDCEKSLDKSYDRIFSESWGDYVEPSQEDRQHTQETGAGEAVEEHPTSRPNMEICETASRKDLDPPSDSESSVIDLSVSPAQEPGDASSFPFVGSSPISPLEKFSGARNATLVECGTTSSKGDSSASKPVDIIVLLDSDEEMELDPGREATTFSTKEIKTSEGEATAHETPSSLYLNHLKEEGEKLLEKSPENPIRPEREDSTSMETSWMIPGTPVLPVRTRHESTQTPSTMGVQAIRRTNLFRKSSRNEPGLTKHRSSTDPDVSCKSSEHSGSCSMGSPSSLDVSESDRIQGSSRSSRISKGSGREIKTNQSTGSLKLSSLKYSPERKSFESQCFSESNSSPKMAEPGVNQGSENSVGSLSKCESDPQALASRRSPATAVFEVEESDEDGHSPPRPDHNFCLDEEPPLPFEMSWSAPRSSELVRSSPLGTTRDAVSPEKSPPSSQPNPTQQPQAVLSMEGHPSLLDSKIWDVWEEEEEDDDILPLSQRVPSIALSQRVKELRTPVARRRKARGPVVPITPMPSYSDMDTPELKAKLNRFGVRPLPKRQMVLKLKEIHQYTHQLTSSDSEDEGLAASSSEAPRPRARKPLPSDAGSGDPGRFEEPGRGASPGEAGGLEGAEQLPASQGSTASSATASEDSFSSQRAGIEELGGAAAARAGCSSLVKNCCLDRSARDQISSESRIGIQLLVGLSAKPSRSNPEECDPSGDEDEEEGFTLSQATVREADKIEAVRRFITSDPELHRSILLYQPLVLSQLQAQLRQAGIRLGAAKLLDFLDSQCITFTTAKPGQPRGHRRRQRGGKSGRHRGAGKGGE